MSDVIHRISITKKPWDRFLARLLTPHSSYFQQSMHYGLNDHEIDSAIIWSFARPLTRLLAPLTCLLAQHCSPYSRTLLRSFTHSLTHSLPSLWERGSYLRTNYVDFLQFQPTVRRIEIVPARGREIVEPPTRATSMVSTNDNDNAAIVKGRYGRYGAL